MAQDYTGYSNTVVDANYPYNKAKDASGATALDGTPLLASLMNDLFGMWQALLTRGGVTPSGSSDTANASDYVDALMAAISKRFTYSATGSHSADTDAQVDILVCDTSGGDITITIANPPFDGKRFFVVATGGNTAFITGTGISNPIPVVSGVQLEINSDSSTLYPINHDKRICKAWVNFDGTGVVTIRDSFNVSSISDNGTGDYAVNFINDMNDINFSVGGSLSSDSSDTASSSLKPKEYNVSYFRFTSVTTVGSLADRNQINVQIFGS